MEKPSIEPRYSTSVFVALLGGGADRVDFAADLSLTLALSRSLRSSPRLDWRPEARVARWQRAQPPHALLDLQVPRMSLPRSSHSTHHRLSGRRQCPIRTRHWLDCPEPPAECRPEAAHGPTRPSLCRSRRVRSLRPLVGAPVIGRHTLRFEFPTEAHQAVPPSRCLGALAQSLRVHRRCWLPIRRGSPAIAPGRD